MTILWRVRWRSRDTNIPAADLMLLHAERGPCSYAENWECSQGKPVWINPMQSALLGKCSHPEWVSQVKWKRRAQCSGELSQQKGKHMECSRNLKCLPMDRAMHTVSCKTSVGPSWRLWWAVLTVSHHSSSRRQPETMERGCHGPLRRPASCSITCHFLTTI